MTEVLTEAATFGWLCVETMKENCECTYELSQPPSGGCVLKLRYFGKYPASLAQPPSGGCVLKLIKQRAEIRAQMQPPSGGCVLKRLIA